MTIRLVTVHPPEPRVPQQIEAGMSLNGRRLILVPAPPAEPIRDVRALGDPFYAEPEHVLSVRVVTEEAWYRMRAGGRQPQQGEVRVYAVDQLWVE